MKDLRSTDEQLQGSREDVKHGTGNTVNNTVITMFGERWVLDLSGVSLHKLHKYLTTMLYS